MIICTKNNDNYIFTLFLGAFFDSDMWCGGQETGGERAERNKQRLPAGIKPITVAAMWHAL